MTETTKFRAEGTIGKNMGNMFAMLTRLRQACLDPRLIKDIKKVPSEEMTLARALRTDKMSDIKDTQSLECFICSEMMVDPSVVLPCKHQVQKRDRSTLMIVLFGMPRVLVQSESRGGTLSSMRGTDRTQRKVDNRGRYGAMGSYHSTPSPQSIVAN